MDQKKVLIVGLDGFTWRVGKRLVAEGNLPTLSRLIKNGCHGILESVIPFETSPAWSSFQTGCHPQKTGVFAFHKYDSRIRQIKLNSYHEIRVPTLWELLSMAGKKVVSINMPMTSPPPAIDGVVIPGLTCPGLSPATVYPPAIYDRYIKPNRHYMILNNKPQASIEEYIEQSVRTEKTRCEIALQLMNDIKWDVFSVQIQSTDAFQHKYWWALDDQAMGFSDADYSKAVKFYEEIDMVIKKLTDAAGESALTVIVSDHGFCSKKSEIGVNAWLSQNGYLRFQSTANKGPLQRAKNTIKEKIPLLKYLAKVYGRTAKDVFGILSGLKDENLYSEKVVSHLRRTIDLDRTFAFCLGGMGGSLYLVNPENQERADEMIEKLLSVYGPESPHPLILEIQSVECRSEDPTHNYCYPDYLIRFSSGVEARISPAGSSVVCLGIQNGKQAGTHERNGIHVFHGPQVKSGYGIDASIVDIVPTILSYLSVPIPNHMDGNVLQDLFTEELNVRYQSVGETKKNDAEYSDDEQSAVEKQLEDLGYL